MTERTASLAPAPPGEAEILSIARIAEAEAGLDIPESKASMVQARLAGRLRQLGMADYRSYVDFVSSEPGRAERQAMISALTTNVSHFFREAHHFALLRDTVLPPLAEAARAGGRIRIWSAGCSYGQEPYSIALTILDLLPDAGRHDIRILATDIDPHAVAAASEGRYTAPDLDPVPEAMRRHFLPDGPGQFRASAALRGLVRFRELNLHGAWPMTGRFDIIFCRNVVIYFAPARQLDLWPRFAAALAPEGWMFVGHSERIPPGRGFRPSGVTAYRPDRLPTRKDQ